MKRFAIRKDVRDLASIALFGFMAVCLAFALAGEGIDLAWLNKPIGNIAGDVADGFGWAFAVALIALFVLIVSDQKPLPPGVRRFNTGPGH